MGTSSKNPKKQQFKVEQVFKEFGEPGYFLSPHKSKIGKLVFKNLWVLSVLLLVLTLTLFIRHFTLSTAWEYRRLIYQYHTMYQDELISLDDFYQLERRILKSLEIENNYNDDPEDDSTYWMVAVTRYLTYSGDLILPLEKLDISEFPNFLYCVYLPSLGDCYWEFFYEVMSTDNQYSEQTAINALYHLFYAGYMSEFELSRLYQRVVEEDPISETTSLEIQAHFIRGFLEEADTVYGQQSPEVGSTLPDADRILTGEIEAELESHQLKKISAYLVHLLDRFIVEVATITFLVVTIFWSRSFFNISKQAPATFFQLASVGRIMVPDSSPEELTVDPTQKSWLRRQLDLGRQLIKTKPHWQNYVVDMQDSASSPWVLLLFFFWMAFVVLILNWAGMEPDDFSLDSESSGMWFLFAIGVIAAYIYTVQFWILLVVARYLQILPEVFDLEINFKHYDRSGGLGRIGSLSFKMAMIYIVPAIFVAVFLSYIIYRSTTEVVELVVISSQFNWLLSVIFFGVLILLALANLTFFLPLWGIHKQMVVEKAQYEDHALLLTRPIDHQLQISILSEEDQYAQIEELQKRLEAVELIYPSDIRLTTWPISSSAIISFITTQVVPFLSLIGTIISLFG